MIWGVYLRLSKDDARGGEVSEANSITGQRRYCREYISRQDPEAVIVEFAEEEFISASKGLERPAYLRMLEAVSNKELNHIVARDQDRFTRDRDIEFGELKQICKLAGVSVHTTDSGEIFGSLDRELASGMRAEFGQFYANLIGVNARKGLKTRREAGQWTKPGSIYGYDKGGVVNAEQAKQIRWAYDQILNHQKTVGDIYDAWNANSVLTARGKPWYSPHPIRRMLLSPTIAGIVTYEGKALDGVEALWEAIVTPEEQARLKAAISATDARKRGHGQRTARRYMLAGKALCGGRECDLSTMVSINNGVKLYYSHSRRHGGGCGNYAHGEFLERLAQAAALYLLTQTPAPVVSDYDDTELRAIETQRAEIRAAVISNEIAWSDAKAILDGLNERLTAEEEQQREHDARHANAAAWHEDQIDKIVAGDHDAVRSAIDHVLVYPDGEAYDFIGTNGFRVPIEAQNVDLYLGRLKGRQNRSESV